MIKVLKIIEKIEECKSNFIASDKKCVKYCV